MLRISQSKRLLQYFCYVIRQFGRQSAGVQLIKIDELNQIHEFCSTVVQSVVELVFVFNLN